MTELTITGTKLLEQHMGIWNNLLQLNVLKKANYKEDEEHYNNINEVVYSIFKIAIQARQLKQETEGDDTINENYDDYEEEIAELIKKEIAYLQNEHPEILINMPTSLFKRMVNDVLQDKDTMNIAIVQWINMMQAKENVQTIANVGVVESDGIGGIAGGQSTNGMPVTGGMPMGGMPMGGMPMGGMPMGGMPGQFPQNMDMYPQNQNQNQDATIVPQDTPEGQEAIDEIDKQTDGQFKKKLKSITKNGIHPQVALVATNSGALLAGMLIPGAGFLIMTVALKANLEILPKWPKKKLIPVTENWFEDPKKNNPDKDNPNNDKDNPNNPQQTNQQMPQNGGWPNNMMGPNGAMMGPNGAMMGPNGAMMGPNGAMMGPNGVVQGGVNGVGVKKPLQIWETVASNLVYTNRIKTETKLTYYVDKDGKIYINAKESGIESEKEYIELTKDNLQKYLTSIAEKNGLGEAEVVKEFIEQINNIAKGEIGIKEINGGLASVIKASTKLSEMMDGDKLSDYGKEIYNELLLKKIENLVEFDPQKPIEEEVIKQLEETQKILTEKLTPENLEKLNDEEKEQFTQMLHGVNSTLNMVKIYQGVKLIEEKEQEIDLLKDKKKLNELYTRRDNNNKQEKELNESNNAIQEEKKNLNKQIEEEQEQVNKFQEIVNLQTKRDDLEKQFEKELEALYDSLERSKEILGDDMIDDGLIEQIENKIKERDERLTQKDEELKQKKEELKQINIQPQQINEYLQQHKQNLNKLNQEKQNLETREKENNEKIATITESKDEIDKEIKQYEDRVKTKQADIEKELEQSKQEKLNKLQNEKKEVEKLKKEKEEIEASKKELDELILKKEKEIENIQLSNDANGKQNETKIEQEQKEELVNSQTTDENIKETYNNKIKEKNDIIKEINNKNAIITKYKKEKESLEKEGNEQEIENLQNKIEELEDEIKNLTNSVTSIDLKIKDIKPQVELMELKEKRQQKEKEAEGNEEKLKNSRTIEIIDEDITNTNNIYNTKKNNLIDTNSIEKKQEEVKKMKEEVSQQKQNCMSQDLVLIQHQMLQKSQFAGLSKVLKVESVDMPKYQAPVISVGQGQAQHVEMTNNI